MVLCCGLSWGRKLWPLCTVREASSAVYVTYFLHVSNNSLTLSPDSDLASRHLAGKGSACWWYALLLPLPHSHWALMISSWELLNWPWALGRESTLKLYLQWIHGNHLTWRKRFWPSLAWAGAGVESVGGSWDTSFVCSWIGSGFGSCSGFCGSSGTGFSVCVWTCASSRWAWENCSSHSLSSCWNQRLSSRT